MYYVANDYELLYLIKDGNAVAYRVLYKKYEYLIKKFYYENYKLKKLVFLDFKQECLLCLEKAIHLFNEKYQCSFYSFFLMLIKRNTLKLLRTSSLQLREEHTRYISCEEFKDEKEYSFLLKSVIQQLEFSDNLEKDLFYECILGNVKIIYIVQKYKENYSNVYAKYKKVKAKIEKILTN